MGKNQDISLTEKTVNITPPLGITELTLREGDAIHPKELAAPALNISGTLSAPFNFISGKPTLASDAENNHLLIDLENGKLTLVLKDQDPFSKHTITGQLTKYGPLAPFGINTEKRWSPREFMKFIRQVKVFFSDRSEVDALIESLMKWQAKVETVVKDHNDNSGNSLTQLEKKVSDVQLKTKFDLLIPIYKGYSKIKFTVEIGLDPKNSGVDLFLVSDELFEQEILQRETIMADELAKFDSHKFSKVVIS